MPATTRTNAEGDIVVTYVMPVDVAWTSNIGPEHIQRVKEHRKFYATQVGELAALQKAFGAARDADSARAIKEHLKHFTQAEKCTTLVINLFEKGNTTDTKDFPPELADLLDYEFRALLGPDYFKETT